MTKEEKRQILDLRAQGKSYAEISETMDLSFNTISSFCRRYNADGVGKEIKEISTCKNCGSLIKRKVGHKPRQFCSDACRMEWWNAHQGEVNRKAIRTFTCACCGREFETYGQQRRRYCSHACYIAGRYGREVPAHE